ncbi:MAG TPA: TetR family transcriptional regulator [Roseomonas sp.]
MSESEPDNTALLAGFWQVVALRGWHGVTMGRVAQESGLPLAALRARVRTPLDLLLPHGREADRMVLAGTIRGQGGSPRDRIFDVLMRRLDAMQPHRPGILRLLSDIRRDPLLALFLAPHLLVSMAWMLEAAELDTALPAGAWRMPGLAAVWLAAVRAWREDDNADLGMTMAALDRALDRAEGLARTLRLPVVAGDADAVAEEPAPPA